MGLLVVDEVVEVVEVDVAVAAAPPEESLCWFCFLILSISSSLLVCLEGFFCTGVTGGLGVAAGCALAGSFFWNLWSIFLLLKPYNNPWAIIKPLDTRQGTTGNILCIQDSDCLLYRDISSFLKSY